MTTTVEDVELVSALARALREWPAVGGDPERHWSRLAEQVSLPEVRLAEVRRHKLVGPYLLLRPGNRTEEARQRRRAAVLADELAGVTGRLGAAGVEHALLRGPAVAQFYPAGWPREANDIDLVVRHPRQLAVALDALTPAGWFTARPVVTRRDRGAGGSWAAAALNKLRPDLGHPVYLDLTVGGPAVDRSRCVPVPDAAWASAIPVRVADSDVPAFDPTHLVVLLAVEWMEREEPTGRDLMDFVVLRDRVVDWDYVGRQIRDHRLQRGVHSLSRLAASAGLADVAEQLRRLTPTGGSAGRTWRLRTLAGVDRLYIQGMRRNPVATLAVVERLPAAAWFAGGLPVYAYPPRRDGRPLRGAAGRAAGGLAGYRARVRPVAEDADVDDVFGPPGIPDPYAPLTAVELDWWRDMLARQSTDAADGAPVDQEHVTAVAAALVADGGAEDTIGVRDDGVTVAAARLVDCRHPVTRLADRRLEGLCLAEDAEDPAGAVAELLSRVPADLDVRVELPAGPAAERLRHAARQVGFREEILTVRRSAVAVPDPGGWSPRPAGPQDADFVYDCLAVAVRRGLAGRTAAVDVGEWVRERWPGPAGPDVRCVLAELDGRPVGHAYALIVPDRYLATRTAHVIDVFVLPEARGRSCSQALVAALGRELEAGGVANLESEVVLGGRTDTAGLVAGLLAAGWRVDRAWWLREAA